MISRNLVVRLLLSAAIGLGTWGTVSAYHSYVLTVQDLNGGLQKAPNLAQKGFTLIDVRTPEEHSSGFIPGTDFNIDFREIGARHKELGTTLDDHIVVYCQSGQRSNVAAETLADLGYQHVYNVAGSMNEWTSAGYPIEFPRR